jgi:uncharacterized membrane protein YfcA
MSISIVLILMAIGIIAGSLSGLLGIGGAIVMVPALVYFLGVNQQLAQGTSLAVIPITIFAAYNYFKAGQVNLKFALILAACFLIGSLVGSKFALSVPENILKKIFGVLLLLVAAKMLFFSK